jgi:hypothetical protein
MISPAVLNLVTPKAGAKHEHLFNEAASGLFIKSLSSAPTVGVTQLTNVSGITLVAFSCAT